MPQPYLVPVRPIFSRIAHSSGVSGSTSTSKALPLIVRLAIRLSHSGLFVRPLNLQCWTEKRNCSNQDSTLVGGIICGGVPRYSGTRLTGTASQRVAGVRAIAVRGVIAHRRMRIRFSSSNDQQRSARSNQTACHRDGCSPPPAKRRRRTSRSSLLGVGGGGGAAYTEAVFLRIDPPPPTPPHHAQERMEGGEITTHEFTISRHDLPEVCFQLPALSIRGRRECRAPDAPHGLVCNVLEKTHTSIQVTPESTGIPRAMVLTVSFALSPATGLSCHRRP